MACKIHKHRKRPNTCSDCAAELKLDKNLVPKAGKQKPHVVEKVKKKEEKKPEAPVEKTSRDMLAEISSMEKEVDEMVIKPERQKKEKPVINTAPPKAEAPEEAKSVIELNKEAIDDYFQEKLKTFKEAVAGLSHIQYEYLDLPLEKMSVATMDKLYSDKWHLVNFLNGQCAKASGFSNDVAIFDRVKGNGSKTAAEWKKEIK